MRKGYTSLVGQTFGRLLVLEEVRNKIGLYQCRTLCRCGNKKLVYKSHLKSGKTKSCGCLGKPPAVPTKLVKFISIGD